MRVLLLVMLLCRVASATCERAHCFQLRLHVARDVATSDWIDHQIERANHYFEPVGTAFVIANTDDAATGHVITRANRNAFAKQVAKGEAIDVFVVAKLGDVDKPGEQIYGVTWRANGHTFIIVSAEAWERTLGHELGHLFGLPHSTYANSIMNDSLEQFADEELEPLRAGVARARSRLNK
jgi:hypothetical protein